MANNNEYVNDNREDYLYPYNGVNVMTQKILLKYQKFDRFTDLQMSMYVAAGALFSPSISPYIALSLVNANHARLEGETLVYTDKEYEIFKNILANVDVPTNRDAKIWTISEEFAYLPSLPLGASFGTMILPAAIKSIYDIPIVTANPSIVSISNSDEPQFLPGFGTSCKRKQPVGGHGSGDGDEDDEDDDKNSEREERKKVNAKRWENNSVFNETSRLFEKILKKMTGSSPECKNSEASETSISETSTTNKTSKTSEPSETTNKTSKTSEPSETNEISESSKTSEPSETSDPNKASESSETSDKRENGDDAVRLSSTTKDGDYIAAIENLINKSDDSRHFKISIYPALSKYMENGTVDGLRIAKLINYNVQEHDGSKSIAEIAKIIHQAAVQYYGTAPSEEKATFALLAAIMSGSIYNAFDENAFNVSLSTLHRDILNR